MTISSATLSQCQGSEPRPAAQHYRQEIGLSLPKCIEKSNCSVQLIEILPNGTPGAFAEKAWFGYRSGTWQKLPRGKATKTDCFYFSVKDAAVVETDIPAGDVLQLLRAGATNWVLTTTACIAVMTDGTSFPLQLPEGASATQMTASSEGRILVATTIGLFERQDDVWKQVEALDSYGRDWARNAVLGVSFDSHGQLWIATKAGVGCRSRQDWQFFTGKDGLPWNDFTSVAAGRDGEVWFTTHWGVIRLANGEWHYRQGKRWLPDDDVRQAVIDSTGNAWFATRQGPGCIARKPMSLEDKAAFYENEIEKHIKRTPLGYVSQSPLRVTADKSSAQPLDLDNDGLWTAMYGAGECFAYAASKSSQTKLRAKQAFEALRFLQKVTQGGSNAPPKGFVARTIRPSDWPDPNLGLNAKDRAQKVREPLWKVHEPRWPKSADGKWYWKSDTSSDELDGHYFFYPLYFDLCAESPEERARVAEVVRDLTDHLLTHDYRLIDHDGQHTRWGVFDPKHLNQDPLWWPERGLNSLSILTYLHVAAHITGDSKYRRAAEKLVANHGYGQNLMFAKVHYGAGSGNQSDDEMAIMNYYGLLRCLPEGIFKDQVRSAFFLYLKHEAMELNPFFHFAYAAHNQGKTGSTQHGDYSLSPTPDWLADSMATLYGFPLDRLNWAHRNSHRLDVVFLSREQSKDFSSPDAPRTRGYRSNGKVLPVENRHFTQWNTDPWQLDYKGDGDELAAGTAFLLPYYMGLYHGFIEAAPE